MGEQRRVYQHGNSWVIPVPRRVRDHLRVVDGGDLFWHLGPKGEAFVTRSTHRIGGKPPGQRLEKDLAERDRIIERLRRQLASRPAAVYNEGVNEGRMAHVGELVKLGAQLDALQRIVNDMATRLPYRRHHVPRARPTARTDEQRPAPVQTPPLEVIDGGDVASGA